MAELSFNTLKTYPSSLTSDKQHSYSAEKASSVTAEQQGPSTSGKPTANNSNIDQGTQTSQQKTFTPENFVENITNQFTFSPQPKATETNKISERTSFEEERYKFHVHVSGTPTEHFSMASAIKLVTFTTKKNECPFTTPLRCS